MDEVILNDNNIIEVSLPYKTPLDVFAAKFQKVYTLSQEMKSLGHKALIFVDFTDNLKPQDINVKLAEKGLKDLDFDKMATFGTNDLMRKIVNELLDEVYKGSRVKHFDNRVDAFSWLLEE